MRVQGVVIKNNAFALCFGLTHWWWHDKMWYRYMILTIKRMIMQHVGF
jgi:hypothetical protein